MAEDDMMTCADNWKYGRCGGDSQADLGDWQKSARGGRKPRQRDDTMRGRLTKPGDKGAIFGVCRGHGREGVWPSFA